jgi:hypothetical protein
VNKYRATGATVACTLTAEDRRRVGQSWQRLLRSSLVSRTDLPGGIRLEVSAGSADALRALIDVERECCRWIRFLLEGPAVVMTTHPAGETALRQMFLPDSESSE